MSFPIIHITGDAPGVYTVVLDVTSHLAGKRILLDSSGNTWEVVGPNDVAQCCGDLYGYTDFRTIWTTNDQVAASPTTALVGM